ncbi:Late embryogenesis abundant protein D-34 [Heracleum sosnowskyi]|uniref:Late embryogenesis abundant protein D-34 n=1 Tax=Heracleum sosnowskyi TaxID=360622 RepID=A0AAD8LXE0_9APIA|nr:Late embryogenesis abundant protein D-34 [Heracleum sosnowskyi]
MSKLQQRRPQYDASQNMASHDASSAMQSAATKNANATSVAKVETVSAQGGERHVIAESVGGQVVGGDANMSPVAGSKECDTITIGEALEATALSEAGDKPVEKSDAAAIQAAEVRATGSSQIAPGGLAATAQSAATINSRTMDDANKTTLGDVLADASLKLPDDQPVKEVDAERIIGAELRNDPELTVHPGGVATSMAVAAELNKKMQ